MLSNETRRDSRRPAPPARIGEIRGTSEIFSSALFFMMVAAATWFITTMSSPLVPFEVPFGLMRILPAQYWMLLSLTIILLLTSSITRRLPYLWASGITLTAIVPGLGNLIYAYPTDIFATVATQYISKTGTFNPAAHIFLSFPGSEIIFSSIAIATRVEPITVVRAYGILYNPLLLIACYVSLRRFGATQVPSLLGALVFVLGFYLQGVLIYSSLNGFLFYVCIASLILVPLSGKGKNTILITLFFAAMIVTHAFSPFLTLAGILGLWVGAKLVERVAEKGTRLPLIVESQFEVGFTTPITLLLMTMMFWAYLASGPFSAGLFQASSIKLATILQEATSPLLTPQTPYEVQYASLARLYAPILFIPFLVYLVMIPDSRRLQMLFVTLGLAGAIVVALAGYAQEFLPRIFAFALLPLSYGVAKLFESRQRAMKVIAVTAFILVLSLHIPAHYGQDASQQYPISTIAGPRFLAEHTHPNSTFVGIAREFSWNYYFDVYRTNLSDTEPGGFYHVLAYEGTNWLIYTEGENASSQLSSWLDSSSFNSIYSNGLFTVYT